MTIRRPSNNYVPHTWPDYGYPSRSLNPTVNSMSAVVPNTKYEMYPEELLLTTSGFDRDTTSAFFNGYAHTYLQRLANIGDMAYHEQYTNHLPDTVMLVNYDTDSLLAGASVAKIGPGIEEVAVYILRDGRMILLVGKGIGYTPNQCVETLRSNVFDNAHINAALKHWLPSAEYSSFNQITYAGSKGGAYVMDIDDPRFKREKKIAEPKKTPVVSLSYSMGCAYGSVIPTTSTPIAPAGPTEKEIELAIELRDARNDIDSLKSQVHALQQLLQTSATEYEEAMAAIRELL